MYIIQTSQITVDIELAFLRIWIEEKLKAPLASLGLINHCFQCETYTYLLNNVFGYFGREFWLYLKIEQGEKRVVAQNGQSLIYKEEANILSYLPSITIY